MYNKHQAKNEFCIAHWNANGLKNNLTEVAYFLEAHKIDIMLINEVKLKEKTKCKIPGYQCFRRDRPGNTAGGGVAIYCKKSLECTELNIETSSVESKTIKLKNNVAISSIYACPQTKNAKHKNWNCRHNN